MTEMNTDESQILILWVGFSLQNIYEFLTPVPLYMTVLGNRIMEDVIS